MSTLLVFRGDVVFLKPEQNPASIEVTLLHHRQYKNRSSEEEAVFVYSEYLSYYLGA